METTKNKILPLPNADTAPQTVLLANGDYPSDGIPAVLLRRAAYVVCCDGAANRYLSEGGVPDAVVGDGDSIDAESKAALAGRFLLNPDQETNDLTKAFEYCISRGRREITLLGATGKREDHTLANISLLAEYATQAEVQMVTPTGVFNAFSRPTRLESRRGEQISIFTIDPATRISAENLVYPLPAEGLRSWWCGTLNEAQGDSFTIHTDKPTIIFRAFEVK